jgi:LmbE family N-acetylglucosaminyl deacetylase
MNRLLAIFAHPDDEGAVGGTLAQFASQGDYVALACMTLGEAGEINDPDLGTRVNLGEVRERELRCAADRLGVSELFLLGYCDSGMDGTPENDRATAFIRADPDDVLGILVRLIRQAKPHLVLTFEPFGWYGHPDHVVTHRYVTEAFHLSADARAFPEAGDVWQAERLYYSVFPIGEIKIIANYAMAHGLDFGAPGEFLTLEASPAEGQITHQIDVSPFFEAKRDALFCHRTQFGPDDPMRHMPEETLRTVMVWEHFIQAHPAQKPTDAKSADLLA